MHVWVLETFDREDRYCEYNSQVVAIYSEENFKKAKIAFEKLCDSRNEGDVDSWENAKGYFFSSEMEDGDYFKASYVSLKKMEVM